MCLCLSGVLNASSIYLFIFFKFGKFPAIISLSMSLMPVCYLKSFYSMDFQIWFLDHISHFMKCAFDCYIFIIIIIINQGL